MTYSRQVQACPKVALISGGFLLPLSEAFRQNPQASGFAWGKKWGKRRECSPVAAVRQR